MSGTKKKGKQKNQQPKAGIKTYNTIRFRDKFMKPEKELNEMLKPGFDKFFIARVQEMLKLIKLPVPPSRATTHSFIYLTEGFAEMNIGSETFKIFSDECLFVPAGQVFSFSNLDLNKGFICNFHSDFLIGEFGNKDILNSFEFLAVWGNPRVTLNSEQSKYVFRNLSRIYSDYKNTGLKNTSLIHSYFLAVLNEVRSAYQQSSSAKSQSHVLTNAFRELLFRHVREKHLVSEYASVLCVTPNHLNKVVKSVTGKSPTAWIDETLILEAKVLLYQTNIPVSEIASEIGFDDASYFSRMFKKYEGVSPIEFRKMIEKS